MKFQDNSHLYTQKAKKNSFIFAFCVNENQRDKRRVNSITRSLANALDNSADA